MIKNKEERDSYLETFHKVIEEANKRTSKHVVLIVDDEPDNLALLRRTLRSKYEVITATNGQEALGVVNERGSDISLIISDQKMPVMQGTEFFSHVAQTYPNIIKMLLQVLSLPFTSPLHDLGENLYRSSYL